MSAWKACDLRGKYPEDVSPELLYQIGSHIIARRSARVLIAGDFRLSTPELKSALAEGLLRGGAQILDAGQVPTPVAYFAHQHWKTDAILIVTASHNPAGHNGLKFMIGGLPPSEEDLRCLRASLTEPAEVRAGGAIEEVDPVPGYKRWIEERWAHVFTGAPLRIVLDAGNGAWSELAPELFERLGFRVCRLFCEIDGRFPHRPPDCSRAANLRELSQVVQREKADLGVAWDGDGDRVAFVSEDGKVITADQVSLLFAKHLLAGTQGERVVHDIKLSDILRRTVEEMGATAIVERSGHTFLKRRMIEQNCLLGCEASGHYFFRELRGADDGLFASLLMAKIVMRDGPLGALESALPPMFISPDLRLAAGSLSYEQMVSRLRDVLRPARETVIDGFRFETPNGFALIRRSVTEAAITLRLEGLDGAGYRRLVEQCVQALPEIADQLQACG